MADYIKEIKDGLKQGKVMVGTNSVIKNLKLGKALKVYVASNCKKETKENVRYYAGLSKTNVIELKQPNDELGVLCKRPFSISVLAFIKGA